MAKKLPAGSSSSNSSNRDKDLQEEEEEEEEEGEHQQEADETRQRDGARTSANATSNHNCSVRVAVRIRPLLPKEIASRTQSCLQHQHQTVQFVNSQRSFTYDHVFPVHATQSDLYQEALQPLMESFLQGFNVTVIAYGQTGSGKTYTMGNNSVITASNLFRSNGDGNDTGNASAIGDDELEDHEGLIPRFLHDLFGRLAKEQGDCQTSVSFLEIYGEDIHDLLDNSNNFAGSATPMMPLGSKTTFTPEKLQLRESKNGVWVRGLTEVNITNRSEAMEQMRLGCLHRITASTEMNERSSRSHAVYTVKLVRRVQHSSKASSSSSTTPASAKAKSSADSSGDRDSSSTICSKLTFVDLAGSERLKKTQAEGNRMKEGIQINVGLLALGNVINALGDERRRASSVNVHVPYRSSKLTRLLQDALGGNSRTLFIACVSPAETNENESLNTLQYANRARNIQNKAIKNVDRRSAELLGLKAFNSLLRRELVRVRYLNGVTNKAELSCLKELIDSKLRDPSVISYLKMLEEMARSQGLSMGGAEIDFEMEDTIANISVPRLDAHSLVATNGGTVDQYKDNSLEHSTTDSMNSESSDSEEFDAMPESISSKELGLLLDVVFGVLEKDSLVGQLAALEKRFDLLVAQKDTLLNRHKLKLRCLKDSAQKLASLLSDPMYSKENNFSPETKRKYDEMRKTIEMTHAKGKEIAHDIVKLQAERSSILNDKERETAKLRQAIDAIQAKTQQARTARENLKTSPDESTTASDDMTLTNVVDVVVRSNQIKLQHGLKDLVCIGDRLEEEEKALLPLLDKTDEVVRLPESFLRLLGQPRGVARDARKHMKCIVESIKNEIQEYVDHEDIEVCLSREIRNRAALLQKIIHQSMASHETLETFMANQEALNACEANIAMFSDALRSRAAVRSQSKLDGVLQNIKSIEDARVLIQLLVQELFVMKRLELCELQQDECQTEQSDNTNPPVTVLADEIAELKDKHAQEIAILTQEYEQEVVGALQMAMIDSNLTKVADKQLVLLGQKCQESNEKVQTMQEQIQHLQQELAAKQTAIQQLQADQQELQASLENYQEREEAMQMMNKCEEIWRELGIDESDRKDKIKNINNILVKKCTEEIESLQSARETLLKRIQVTVSRIQLLGETLQLSEYSTMEHNPQHLDGSRVVTLLDQEKQLAETYGQLQQVLLQRISTRKKALEAIQTMMEDLEIAQEEQFAALGVKTMDLAALKLEIQDFLSFVGECNRENEWDLEKMLSSRWISGAQRATSWFTPDRLAIDDQLLVALRKEKNNRIVQADELLTRIRSLVGEMALSRADLLGIFDQAVLSGMETREAWEEFASCILQQGGRVDISRRGMQRLTFLRDCLQDVHDGRTNAISFLCATLEEAAQVMKAAAKGGSGGPSEAEKQSSAKDASGLRMEEVGCTKQALITGSQRLRRLNEPVEANIRAILFSMNEDFNAFGIETDSQRISFFLATNQVATEPASSSCSSSSPTKEAAESANSSDQGASKQPPSDPEEVKRNARRKAMLEKYLVASTSSAESELLKAQALKQAASSTSFLSDLDPCFLELGPCFSAVYGTRQLESLRTSIEELDLIAGTIECAQKRLFSLRKIMKLFNETREYQKKITEFEAEASKKDRLFGNSMRLLEEERFRKAAAKRYPLLIATLRKEVDKWLKREEAEFNLNILGPELKELLLDMMNTHTELMHLDLGLVDASRTTTPQASPLPPTPIGFPTSTAKAFGLPPSSGTVVSTASSAALAAATRRASRSSTSSVPPPVPLKPATPRLRTSVSQPAAKKRLDFDKN